MARATVTIPGASKAYRFKPATKQLAAGTKTKLKLSFAKRSLRAIRRALSRHRKLWATLRLTATDPSGAVTTKRLAIRLVAQS